MFESVDFACLCAACLAVTWAISCPITLEISASSFANDNNPLVTYT